MDPSGSPRWLASSDPWQASTLDAVATRKIPAASSSAWEDCAGFREAADDEEAADAAAVKSSECSPGAIAGSSELQGSRGSRYPSVPRGHRREAGFVVRIGEGETTSASSSIGETDSCHGGVHCQSEEAPLATRCREALRKAEHDKEVDVQGVADATSRSANANFATCGSCWGKWPVFSQWSWNCNVSCSTMVFLWSHRRILWSSHQFLRSGFARGRITFQRRNTRCWSGWQTVTRT